MNNSTPTTITEESITKKEFQAVALKAESEVANNGGLRLAFKNFAELEKFSNFMALSAFVPKHLRQKQADCLAVLLQAMRWEMDPFAVAQKTYFVNDGMAYEAQLVNAIIISRAPLKARPKLEWSGEGENLKCKVSATFKDEDEPQVFEAEMKTITTKNSPLWKQQPKQQLGYFALRAWARLYCPDVLMGVYTKEEMENPGMGAYGPDNAIDVTPPTNTSALDDINSQIKASVSQNVNPLSDEAKQSSASYENAAYNKPSEEVAAQNQAASTAEISQEKPKAELTLIGWQKALNEAATADEVNAKRDQAVKQFAADSVAVNALNATADKRIASLSKAAA